MAAQRVVFAPWLVVFGWIGLCDFYFLHIRKKLIIVTPMTQPAAQDKNSLALGKRLRALRKARSVSLAVLARKTGVSEATLSRIETGHSAVSAQHLYRLAGALYVEVTVFFNAAPEAFEAGARSVSRKGSGDVFRLRGLQSEVLCADLFAKRMHPYVNEITAYSLTETDGMAAHAGEEYLYVLAGSVTLHTQGSYTQVLHEGDSIYFDASQPHCYVNAQPEKAKILVVTSTQAPVNKETQR